MAFKDWLPWNIVPNAIDSISDYVDRVTTDVKGWYDAAKTGGYGGSGRNLPSDSDIPPYAKPKNTTSNTKTTYVPDTPSAESTYENSFTVPEDIYGEWTPYLDYLREQSDANSAWNEMMAERQNAWQRETNQIQMDFNAAEAARNREWQQMMSDSAHQREVADLQAAGLNPVLSATGGNGAAVTSGATASGATSAGTKAEKDTSFVAGLLNFLNNIMGYATSTASAGISAGAVLGAANISADATKYASDNSYLSAQNNTSTPWGWARRTADQGLTSAADAFSSAIGKLPNFLQKILGYYTQTYRKR